MNRLATHAAPLRLQTILTLCCAWGTVACAFGGEKLYGIHWWDYSQPTVGDGTDGGWSVETIVTHSDVWWQAPWFKSLYQTLDSERNTSIITRIDYNWGETVPAPGNPDAANWPQHVVTHVVGELGSHSRRWVLGNEPNIIGEGNNWPDNRIRPEDYAQIYHNVRTAIKAVRPQDEVLFAPVSPGGVIAGVRWKSGNDWLREAIDAVLALPGGAIDGFAIHAYGNPFTNATLAAAEMEATYASQLAVIDERGLIDTPVYLTEWSRSTPTTGNLAASEQVTADFIRLALDGIHQWNQQLGAHNIVGTAWFVYNQDYGGWDSQSLEWWRSQGNPEGHPGDLWTALLDTAGLPAGLVGTRPWGDFDRDGDVDAEDYEVWRSEFGLTAGPLQADANGDGTVGAADFVRWRNSLIATGTSTHSIQKVPEPGTGMTLLCGVALAALGKRNIGVRRNLQCDRRSDSNSYLRLLRVFRGSLLLSGCAVVIAAAGCSGRPAAVRPELAPAQMAAGALGMYDRNSDERLSGEELDAVPAVKKYLQLYDQDGDGAVSRDELEARFAGWKQQGLALRRLDIRVTLNGQPLPGATVRFLPEPYMTDWVKPATGTTDSSGLAKMSVAAEDLPESLQMSGSGIRGVYVGTYKVEVTHPSARLRDGYTAGTLLGEEIARDTVPPSIQLPLSSG